jgi:hypothetical protein
MRYKLLLCHSILKKGGPVAGADFATEWLNYRMMAEGADDYEPTLSWEGPQRAFARIMATSDFLSRMAAKHRPCIAGWDAPIGLIHPGDPKGAAENGYTMAVAVASALTSDATMDSVIHQAVQHADCLDRAADDLVGAGEFRGRVERLIELAKGCKEVAELYEPIYREFLVTYPPWNVNFVLEMVPCALAICYVAGEDAEQAIIGAANLGRDADTITSMVGEITGALLGFEAFPGSWVERVSRVNPEPDMGKMAEELCLLLRRRAEDQQKISQALMDLSESTG